MEKRFGILSLIITKNKSFRAYVLRNPFFIALTVLFAAGKVSSNLILGASWTNALRSGLLGLLFYTLACYAIHFLSDFSLSNDINNKVTNPGSFYMFFLWFLFILLTITLNVLNSNNILNFQIPAWGQLNVAWIGLVKHWSESSSYITETGLTGWPYLILYVFIPIALVRASRFTFPKLFGLKTCKAALPFVFIYIAAFVFTKGTSVKSLLTLFFVTVWPALGEEFFFRGILQRALASLTKSPVTAIVLTSLLFTVSHIPVYFFGYFTHPVMAFSSLLPVLFTSFIWGFGYHKTGIIWPWVLIHALSNLVGF